MEQARPLRRGYTVYTRYEYILLYLSQYRVLTFSDSSISYRNTNLHKTYVNNVLKPSQSFYLLVKMPKNGRQAEVVQDFFNN